MSSVRTTSAGTHVDTDPSGSSLEYVLYEPFGRSLADWKSGAYENDRKFTGKELDQDTGWHYYGSRYYASVEGRFLSEDPVFLSAGAASDKSAQERLLADPQLWNSYAYSRNNPVLLTDSSGQFLDVLLDVAFAAFDLGALAYDEMTTGGENRTMNVAALAADVASAAVPFVAGGGIAVRVGAHADEAVDAARVMDAGKSGNTIGSTKAEITKPYVRPSGATTIVQRQAVQNQPCVTCDNMFEKMYADHIEPLVKQYYSNGRLDIDEIRRVDAVQPQCSGCSAKQGGEMSKYSKDMKKELGL